MIINFIIGFIIPWILGIRIYFKEPKIILLIAPISSVIAFTINDWGFYYNFWDFTPVLKEESYSALSFNLGVYPVLFSYCIFQLQKRQIKDYIILFGFVLLTTFLELAFVIIGKVIYHNNWNIYWTFVSYVIAYFIVYLYFRVLKKNQIL